MFGSSGHLTKPDGLVMEAYQHRSPDSYNYNRTTKSFVRPERVTGIYNPHCFKLRGDYLDTDGRVIKGWQEEPGIMAAPAGLARIRIHHYFTKSKQEWQWKVEKGRADTSEKRDPGGFVEYDRNEQPDSNILGFVDQTKAIMETIAGPG
jgi:hypothetical protein